jgi:hypothetical protein
MLNHDDVPVRYPMVFRLNHAGSNVSGDGVYCTDVAVDESPNPMAFRVTGVVARDAATGRERVTLAISGARWGPGPSTNTYMVIQSKAHNILVLRGTNGANDFLSNLDVQEGRARSHAQSGAGAER